MATPTHLSPSPSDTDLTAARSGATLQGFPLLEQGENVARVLEAKNADGFPLYPTVAVLMPRRSTKTFAIWAVLLGRLESIPGYKVVTTAQDGTRARTRFREVARSLEANGFEDTPGNKIRWANGSEALEFSNGSRLWVVAPSAGAFRGEAADVLLFDEAGEYDADKSEDLLTGALPLMDTRPMGQAIIAGTPATARLGLLWDTLEDGRRGKPGTGVVDYSIRDDEQAVDVAEDGTVTLNETVLERVHPGIGTLTTLDRMRARFETMQLTTFEREYLCRFPRSNAQSALDPEAWATAEVADLERPERVGIAFDCAYDGSSASVAYAWRDEQGNAHGEVVAHRPGTSWVPNVVKTAATKYKVPIGYDNIGANVDPAQTIAKSRPRVNVTPFNTKDTLAAAQRIAADVHEKRFKHMPQSDLDSAVENATWRDVGKSGRAFGTKDARAASINPLVAVSLALWQFDQGKDRQPIKMAAG